MLHKFSKLAVLIACLASLTACAEQWFKPGATEQDFEVTKSSCFNQALQKFPPLIDPIQITNGYTTPLVTQCQRSPGTVTCVQSGGDYVPPDIVNLDSNQPHRDDEVRNCLYKQGWRPLAD